VQAAFQDYYRGTIQLGETDANKLHDLKAALDNEQVYSGEQVENFVARYLKGADRSELDPILDECVGIYQARLDEDGQVAFKGSAKAFLRAYGFLAAILPYGQREWEKLSVFLNFLVPKLPAPKEADLSRGVLDAIDMESYRVEKQAAQRLELADANAELEPVGLGAAGGRREPEIDTLSNILKEFNDLFGNIPWKDEDRIRHLITEEIPAAVLGDRAYQNALRANTGDQNVRLVHDHALAHVMTGLLADHTELYKQFASSQLFKEWLTNQVYDLTRRHYETETLSR